MPSLAPSIRPGTSATVSWRPSWPVDGAEHRREGRERIVRDLGPRVRDAPQERRLAGVREPCAGGVGHQLEVQLELARAARLAGLGVPRRLPGRRGEVRVPAAADPAAGDDDSEPRRGAGQRRRCRRRRRSPACRRARRARCRCRRHRACASRARCRRAGRRTPSSTERRRDRGGRASTTRTMSPPRPPSPPSGPPFGTNFSRRKLRPPSPPRPALTRILGAIVEHAHPSSTPAPVSPRSPASRAAKARELSSRAR